MKITWKSLLRAIGVPEKPQAALPPESPKADYSTAMNRSPKKQIVNVATFAGFVDGRPGVVERIVYEDGSFGEIVGRRATTNAIAPEPVDHEFIRSWNRRRV